MKPFSRLFKKDSPPPPPTLAQRVAALQAAPAEVVVLTALGNDDASLRVSAIRLLPDGDALRRLAGLADPLPDEVAATPPAVRQAARERVAQLIDQGSIDFSTFCDGRTPEPEAMAVVALCKDSDRLSQLLASIDDPAVLARLVVDGPSSRLRQSAAAVLDDPAQLHDVLHQVRGKDKAAYRLVKQKCDALVADRRKAEEFASEAAASCASLEQHSTRPHDPLYAATLEVLTARWRALAGHPDPQLVQRSEQAIERCREVIAAREQEIARRAAEEAAEREARDARARAHQAERQAAAERAEADARASAAAAAAREEEDRARAEQRAAQAEAHNQIARLIRLSRDALLGGNTRKAARFRLAIEEAMQSAPALPPRQSQSLQQLDDKLNELRQWKEYVAAPKRVELIEEMEALADSQDEPEALAEHIRALQQEWRTINKGIVIDTSADGERFQRAFQAAFKPCQDYFAGQAAVRRENLEARKRVLERLKAFAASQEAEDADRGLVAQVLREAPREWRHYSPVDRDANRAAEIAFHQALDRLRAVLNAWYDRNETEKSSLIARARHLSSVEDTTQAIDGVTRLHALWKETGPVSRERAQALWDEFRTLCDSVYKRREQAYALRAADLAATKAQAVALCAEVEKASSVSAAERLAAHTKLREWQAAFDALGELPRADARALQDRFARAVSQYEARSAQQDLRDIQAAESNLFEAARLIQAYERAVVQDAPPDEREAMKEAAERFIAAVQRWPKSGLAALKQALARADCASEPDDAARERALRTLCIRCEILGSTPTPPEDEALRREYQMRLLMQGLGQASRADEQDWDAMLAEWIGIGAVAAEVHEHLQRRFMLGMAKRPAKSPRAPAYQDRGRVNARAERVGNERGGRPDGRGRPDTLTRR